MFNIAMSLPTLVGEKVTDTVHEAPAASIVPQVLLPTEKLLAFAPARLTAEMLRAAFPAFAKVKAAAGLLLPTVTLPKSRVVGVKAA
jgi:hypothetical protein